MVCYVRFFLSCLFLFCFIPTNCLAFSWNDLWYTPDQQGARLLKQKQPEAAAHVFSDPRWQGVSAFLSHHYADAVEAFSKKDTAHDYYNRGNALAHVGQYEEAIKSYETALNLQPLMDDAAYNKKILEDFLKEHPQKQSSKGQGKQQQKQDDNQHQAKNTDQKQNDPENQNHKQESQQQLSDQNHPSSSHDQAQQKEPTESLRKQNKTASAANQKQQRNPKQHSGIQQGNESSHATLREQHRSEQEKQDLKQWLQHVPDDPGGLLKQKFLRDHLRRLKGEANPENSA